MRRPRTLHLALLLTTLMLVGMIPSARADGEPPFLTAWGGSGSTHGKFNAPRGIGAGLPWPTDGPRLLVADTDNNRIQSMSPLGAFDNAWGSLGTGPGQYLSVSDVAVGIYGDIWAIDSERNQLLSFGNRAEVPARTIGTLAGGSGFQQFLHPSSIAIGREQPDKYPREYIYALDTGNGRIQKYDYYGDWIGTWGTPGSGNGQMNQASGISVAPGGQKIFVADTGNNRVEVFDHDGNFIKTWGTLGSGPGQFSQPRGISVDQDGVVYVADTGNDRIQAFDMEGNFLFQWGSTGTGEGQFNRPRDIAAGPYYPTNHYVYVLDSGNNRVQVFGTQKIDASISTGGRDVGGGLLGEDPGEHQIVRKVKPGYFQDFDITLANESDAHAGLEIHGAGGNAQFLVTYQLLDEHSHYVTSRVTSDEGYLLHLGPGELQTLRVTITVFVGPKRRFVDPITVEHIRDGSFDSVSAVVRVV